jgi:hypothetical protein
MASNMLPELHNTSDHGAVGGSGSSGAVSQQLFSSPTDFLITLKQAIQTSDPVGPYPISQEDLRDFARTDTNPKQRAADLIAADHFNQLKEFANIDNEPESAVLTPATIADDINLARNNTKPLIDKEWKKWQDNAVGDLGIAGASGVAAVAGVEVPVVPPLALVVGGVALIGAGVEEVEAFHSKANVLNKATYDQEILATWPEINR